MKTRCSSPVSFPAILAVFAVALAHLAGADTMTWVGGAGTNWSDPSNWSPNQIPGNSDTAVIPLGAPSSLVTSDVSVTSLSIEGGHVIVDDSYTLSSQDFLLNNNGQISGYGTHLITGQGNWINGIIGDPNFNLTLFSEGDQPSPSVNGQTTIGNGGVFTISDDAQDKSLAYRELTNLNIVQQNASFETDNALINNLGVWNLGSGYLRIGDDFGTSHLVNSGTIFKASSGEARIETFVSNENQIQLAEGELSFHGGGVFGNGSITEIIDLTPPPPPLLGFGIMTASSSYKVLRFENSSYTFEPGSSLINPASDGQLHFTNESYTLVQGEFSNQGYTRIDNYSTLNLDTSMAHLGSLDVYNGVIQTSGIVYLDGGYLDNLYFIAPAPPSEMGLMSQNDITLPTTTGTFVNQAYPYLLSLTMGYESNTTMEYVAFLNEGMVNQYDSNITLSNSYIENLGDWHMSDRSNITVEDSSTNAVLNRGNFYVHVSESGESIYAATIDAPFLNEGAFSTNANVTFNSTFLQQNGDFPAVINLFDGSTLTFSQGATFSGGIIRADGTLAGDLNISNTVVMIAPAPENDGQSSGNVAGQITFTGNVTLNPDTTISLNIFGADQNNYDQVLVGGFFDLNQASLRILGPSDIAQFITSADYFTIIDTYGDGQIVGVLGGINNADLVAIFDYNNLLLGHFTVYYDSFGMQLADFEAIPEPSTWILMILGGGATLCYYLRRRNHNACL